MSDELSEVRQRVEAENNRLMAFVESHGGRLGQNLARVRSLVSVYNQRHGTGRGRRRVADMDVLRAAVVFLHASVEDFLRSMAAVQVPLASEDVLNAVPLVGSLSSRPEKFFLGKLAAFRGYSVDEVIRRSVAQHLERTTYNSAAEIAALLRGMGVDVSRVEKYFPALEEMIQRRHRIVHRADRVEQLGRGRHHAKPLAVSTVENWIMAAQGFMTETMAAIAVAPLVSLMTNPPVTPTSSQ
jgi:hypothetical protein